MRNVKENCSSERNDDREIWVFKNKERGTEMVNNLG